MKEPVSVLLISPRATYAGEIAQKCYPPLNLLYLARALLDSGNKVRVLDANAQGLSDDEITAFAADLSPDLIGVPLYTEILASVYRMLTRVHTALPGTRLVMGGAHASALPEQTLEDFPFVQFVLRGYAERGITELCEALTGARNLESVNGLTYRQNDTIHHNPYASPDTNLDPVGFPARELVQDIYDQKRYYTLLVAERPIDTLITSRGCPYACNFCYNQDHRYRYHSVDYVMEEILSIHKRGIRDIEICDDTLTNRRERAMELFDRLIKERLPISFRIKSRVDVVDRELVQKAKRAGVYMVSYGMESGDDEMLRRMNKRTTVADNERACRIAKEAGIASHTSWIIGCPGETPESIKRTVNFIIKLKPTTAQLALLRPYPQTAVYQEAKEKGMLRGDWSVNSVSYPWVQLPWVRDRAHIERIVQNAVRRVYYRPYYVWQFASLALSSANLTLARYALQEFHKSALSLLSPGRRRSGSV